MGFHVVSETHQYTSASFKFDYLCHRESIDKKKLRIGPNFCPRHTFLDETGPGTVGIVTSGSHPPLHSLVDLTQLATPLNYNNRVTEEVRQPFAHAR